MRNPLTFFGLALALALALPLLVAARPGDDEVVVIRDDGHRIVVRGESFDDEQWEALADQMELFGEELGKSLEEALADLDLELDVSGADGRGGRWHGPGDHDFDGLEHLGERLGRLGERMSARLEGLDIARDVHVDLDDVGLSPREARQLRRHIERQMRQLERQMERLQEQLADLEDR